MYITSDTIIWCGSFLTAAAVLCGFAFRFFRWLVEQKDQSLKIKEIQEEQTLICFVLLATLDGLKQLGANGEGTKAHEKLSKYINQKAREQKER